ncbi:MAG: fibronectin type III domain-containing protein [Kofleriaceae bacterium]
MRSILLLWLLGWAALGCGSSDDPVPPIDLTPGAPSTVTATVVSEIQIDLDWTPVANAASYDVYQTTDSLAFVRIGMSSTTHFEAKGLTPGIAYRFMVRAIASDGSESEDSRQASAMTPGDTSCFVPFSHPTVAAALADPTCPLVKIAEGTFAERVSIDRDVTMRGIGEVVLDGAAGGSVVTVTTTATAVVIEDVTIRNGLAVRGGGLLLHGGTTLRRVRVEGNIAESAFVGEGGGIYCDHVELALEDTVVIGNRASTTDTASSGTRTLGGGGVFHLGDRLKITGGTIEQNRLTGGGVAVSADDWSHMTVDIDRSSIVGNVIVGGAILGGGISVNYGQLTETSDVESSISINRSEISGNELHGTTTNGGGIFYSCHICDSYLALTQSTVNGNRAFGATGAKNGGVATSDIRNVSVINSTISGNEARATAGPARGGGIGVHSHEVSSVHFASSTISANVVSGTDAAGGGIYLHGVSDEGLDLEDSLTATLANMIVAANRGGDCMADVDRVRVFYEARSTGYNLFGEMGTCTVIAGPGDRSGLDPALLPLADYGGATKTHALAATSPARDLGDPAGCKAPDGSMLAVDQRDLARSANGRCDVGSFEAQ